jgi:hypothetical protein
MTKVTFRLSKTMENEHTFQPGNSVKIFNVNKLTGSITHSTDGLIDLITRAKEKLFLIGNVSTLRHDPFFEALFLYVQKHGLVTEVSK